jgi:DNA-binding response OmpR family regulator
VLRLGALALDPGSYQVTVDGRLVTLAWQEYQLLKFLMQNPGRVFSRQQLLAEVWGVQDYGGTRTVDVHIRRLRFKLGEVGEDLFRTVKNVGYGLVAPSETRADAGKVMPRRPFIARG